MFAKDRILALDIGASKIMLGEFSLKNSSTPVLVNYTSVARNPLEGEQGDMVFLATTVREMLAQSGIKPAPLFITLPGQSVFPRFVKLPGASADMLDELIADEAAQGLPFPIDQVVWDYQDRGIRMDTQDREALVVATKSETARDAAALASNSGLKLEVIEAGPISLYNAVSVNYPNNGECTLVLDIGAKTTNLIFIEGQKLFMRTLPVAGNTITNEIARAAECDASDAEEYKKEMGFVALGGNYAYVEDEQADRVSKIIRNVATRLHQEVNRSINFYRSQQGGEAPTKVLLTGGTARMRHLDTFFQEKLGVPVEYLNPFVNVQVAPHLQNAAADLFLMAPLVGLALRATNTCPVSINLLPEEVASAQRMRSRLPFFAASVVAAIVGIGFWYNCANNLAVKKSNAEADVSKQLNLIKRENSLISGKMGEISAAESQSKFLEAAAASRASYAKVLDAVRASMLPDTWITAISFDLDSADKKADDDEQVEASNGAMDLRVAGFKVELDKMTGNMSPAEKLVDNLVKSGYFQKSDDAVKNVKNEHADRITEIRLRLPLAIKVGSIENNWIDVDSNVPMDAVESNEEEADNE